jgi:hypothetical protein
MASRRQCAFHGRGRRSPLRDTQPLRQSRQGAVRGIAVGAERSLQRGQQDVNPLMGCALAHPEQASLDDLEGVGLRSGGRTADPPESARGSF